MLVGGGHGGSESNSEERAHFGGNDIGWQAFGPAIAFTLLATFVVSARWFARHRLAQCVGLDDYVILLSLVSRFTRASFTRVSRDLQTCRLYLGQ